MDIQLIVKMITEQGILIAIALLALFVVYKYIMMKLDLMKNEFDKKLSNRKFSAKGNISTMVTEKESKIVLDLIVEEVTE